MTAMNTTTTASPVSETNPSWNEVLSLTSPDGRLQLQLGQFDHMGTNGVSRQPHRQMLGYRILRDGEPMTELAAVGLAFTGGPRMFTSLKVENFTTSETDETYKPTYGEHAVYPAAYKEALVQVNETREPCRQFNLRVRVYDGCCALRYELPQQEALADRISIQTDMTEFSFPAGSLGYECLYHEDEYRPRPIHEFLQEQETDGIGHPGAWLPVTVKLPDGRYMAIAEANLRRGSQMCVLPSKREDTLQANQVSPTVHDFQDGPYESAWRLLITADRPADLVGRSYHLEALCPPADEPLAKADWIRPGPAMRDTTISTSDARQCIDLAAATGMRYILFDAGWYGPEPDEDADLTQVQLDEVRLKKAKPDHDGMDLPQVIEYGKQKGVGILLYVNHRLAENQFDRALPVWEKWGIAGIKLGFVHVGPAEWTDWLLTCIEKCAKHKLLVDIHDAYRPTGLSRTYPNLLTQEGIRGNEHMPTPTHNVTLPFTRFIIGAGDYTLCFNNARQKTTNAHQLAMGVVYYSPLQLLYWYSRPKDVADLPGRECWDNLPTTWDETRGLDGEIGQFVAVARRSAKTWYLGVMTNEQPRQLELPLDFLGDGQFDATLYYDGEPASTKTPRPEITKRSQTVSSSDSLPVDLPARSGLTVIFTPRSA